MRANLRTLCLTAVLGLAPFAKAQPVDVSTTLPEGRLELLSQALEQAVHQSPQMLLRSVELARADAALMQAKASRYPSLGGSARVAHETVSTSDRPNSTGDGFFYNLSLNQPVFRWGEISNTVQLGELGRKIAEKSYVEAYRELANNLRAQFLELIVKKHVLMTQRHNLELFKKAREIDKLRRAAGQMSETEYGFRSIDFEEASFAMERAEFDFSQALAVFARLCGLKTVSEDQIPNEIPVPQTSEGQALRLVTQFDQKEGVNDLASVSILRSQVRQGELRYNIAKVRLLPKFEFNAGTSLENQTYLSSGSLNQSATTRNSVGLVANWTLFDGFSTRAAKRQALADKREAELKLQTLMQSLDAQKSALVKQFDFAVQGMAYAERRYALAKNGMTYTEQEIKAGRQPESAIEAAKTAVKNCEMTALASRIEVYTRWASLVSTLGLDPVLQKLPSSFTSNGK